MARIAALKRLKLLRVTLSMAWEYYSIFPSRCQELKNEPTIFLQLAHADHEFTLHAYSALRSSLRFGGVFPNHTRALCT